jgi:tRNA dimethylallyltransferase
MSLDRNFNFDILLIVGPTASGKTAVGIELAKRLDGEIISADSRQIYQQLSIGTAKPTPEELSQAKHHLVDVVPPDEEFDAARFAALADEVIEELWHKDKLPIVVGGSGFYVKALIDGLFDAPSADEELREQLRQQPKETLHEILAIIDPTSAEKLHPNDRKRVIRALEVYELTGKTISQLQKEHQQNKKEKYEPLFIGLHYERQQLYRRIERRVDKMIEEGLIDEVESLLETYPAELNALQTVGYQEIIRYLCGEIDKAEAIRLIKRNTRRYAKRQLTWFRRDERIHWIDVTDLSAEEAAETAMNIIRKFTD